MHSAATGGIDSSRGFGRTAFAQSSTTFPGVSEPSSVVRSIERIASSSARSLDPRSIERFARDAARSSRATPSTAGSQRRMRIATRVSRARSVPRRRSISPGWDISPPGEPAPSRPRVIRRPVRRAADGRNPRTAVPTGTAVPRGRSSEAEPLQRLRVALPLAHDLHAQVEEDLRAEEPLHLLASPRADGLERLPTVADHDALLRVALDDERRVDTREPLLFLDVVDHDGDRVRHLLSRNRERLFADQLGKALLERRVGDLVGRIRGRTLGKALHDEVVQHGDVRPGPRADRNDLVERAELRRSLELGHLPPPANGVDLVDHAELRGRMRRELFRVHERVPPPDAGRGVDHLNDRIDAVGQFADDLVHPRAQRGPRLVEPRRVYEDDLHLGRRHDPADPLPRRLRFVGDDRDLLSDERVYERRLADVRPADDGDDPRPHEASGRSSGPNAAGKRSSSAHIDRAPSFVDSATTSDERPNSHRTWRHAPHGGVGRSSSVTTARQSIRRSPAVTAANAAFRSAHIVMPYEAFSTLTPAKIRPPANAAAPTANMLYGAYACSRACAAAATSRSISWRPRFLIRPSPPPSQAAGPVPCA